MTAANAIDQEPPPPARVLMTGATGYVGGRLLRELASTGRSIRCLTRNPARLASLASGAIEIVGGDVLDRDSLRHAVQDVETAYYLVHSMGDAANFEREERAGAENFAAAAAAAGVRRIIYLGGLADATKPLSPHLRSRIEVGRLLASTGVPVIEFRASLIVGSGSVSFEMVRALVERLPVMVTPRWVGTLAQPIGVTDVISYLLAALDKETVGHTVYEIGGPEQVSYGDLMKEYARQRGLRRLMVPVPVLTPFLSGLWLGLVTPVYARVGRKLIDSIKYPMLVQDPAARDAFDVRTLGVREAIALALRNEDREFAETRWSDALSSAGSPTSWGGVRFGNRLIDSRSAVVPVDAAAAFVPIRRIGGATGWYFANWLWRARAFLDLLAGGVGARRGRRYPDNLAVGDAVDFWRVETYEPDRRLRLSAEMRVPGRAWLEFVVEPQGGGATITQTAIFDPVGFGGLLYWYSLWPIHQVVFAGMLRGIARMAAGNPQPAGGTDRRGAS